MSDPKALLVAGDIHGDPQHIAYLFERAINQDVQAILNVGDFGYWEHQPGGGAFLDLCSSLAVDNDMPLYWIDGNHENHTMLRERYGPNGENYKPTDEGFWEIRPGVYYIPRGTRWTWNGVRLMGLGGAYSVDKDYRLAREQGRVSIEWGWTAGHVRKFGATGPGTMWWPEEELSDEELEFALSDPEPLDILFSHDKPRASNPPWNRKDLLECYPNQDKIQTVIRNLTPKLVVHGHLHFRYEDQIRARDDLTTYVVGLDCNPDQPSDLHNKKAWAEFEAQRLRSWARLSLDLT